jgi:hypothetical protein
LPLPLESMSAFLRSVEMQEYQATLAGVSLTGHLVHKIAAPNDDGALLSMRIIVLAIWRKAFSVLIFVLLQTVAFRRID